MAFFIVAGASYPGIVVGQMCPPIPPKIAGVKVTSVQPGLGRSGSVVHFQGQGFDLLPQSTRAWFNTSATLWTAFSNFVVESPTSGYAVVPSYHLSVGPGFASLYYTESYDCSAQGGSTNEIAGNWVSSDLLSFKVLPPSPVPFPASHLSVVATAWNELRLTWRDNSNNETDFEICEGPTPQGTSNCLGAVPANQITEPITGALPDTQYCYEVRARNAHGYEPVPDEAKACATTPSVPKDIGVLTTSPVPGFHSAFCQYTGPIVLDAWRDRNQNGVVEYVGTPALNAPAPAWLNVDIGNVPPWQIEVANRYTDSSNMLVAGNVNTCGVGRPQFFAIHLEQSGGAVVPRFALGGDLVANTGIVAEEIGWVQIGDELHTPSLSFDSGTGRVKGTVGGVVYFQISANDVNGNTYTLDAATAFELSFPNGVLVEDE